MRACFLICFIGLFGIIQSQNLVKPKPKKEYFKKTDFGLGVGITRSVVFLSRNVKENNEATGFTFNAIYGGHNLVRLAFDYTDYRIIHITPTWLNIKAKTYELNVQFLARFKEMKALMYPITGISYNSFYALFTGQDDFQGLRDYYKANTYVRNNWLGANFGLGYEQQISFLKLFINYKMRVGAADITSRINIMDVCYGMGLRYDMKAYTPRHFYRSIFRKTRSRYELDLKN